MMQRSTHRLRKRSALAHLPQAAPFVPPPPSSRLGLAPLNSYRDRQLREDFYQTLFELCLFHGSRSLLLLRKCALSKGRKGSVFNVLNERYFNIVEKETRVPFNVSVGILNVRERLV